MGEDTSMGPDTVLASDLTELEMFMFRVSMKDSDIRKEPKFIVFFHRTVGLVPILSFLQV